MFEDEAIKVLNQAGELIESNISSPWELLRAWKNFIEFCESGYTMCIYEYEYDLFLREYIEIILLDNNLKKYPEHIEFAIKVARLDERFKKLLSKKYTRNDRSTWWEAGIPLFAEDELAKDLHQHYDIPYDLDE